MTRRFLLGSAGLFIVSCVFPVSASVVRVELLPTWIGVADVVIAAGVIALGIVLLSKKPDGFSAAVVTGSFRTCRVFAHVCLALLALFLLVGDSIRWNVLVPGLAWRGWLLTMVLPSWLALWHEGEPSIAGEE
jgi:hypothetical protein